MVVGEKSGMVSLKPPRSRASTCRPASVSSFAIMLAVQPKPTSTTSTAARRVAMSTRPHGAVAPGDAHERHVVLLAVLIHLGDVVVARARKADELPADEIAVAAIHRIGEETFHGVVDQHRQEGVARSAGK